MVVSSAVSEWLVKLHRGKSPIFDWMFPVLTFIGSFTHYVYFVMSYDVVSLIILDSYMIVGKMAVNKLEDAKCCAKVSSSQYLRRFDVWLLVSQIQQLFRIIMLSSQAFT